MNRRPLLALLAALLVIAVSAPALASVCEFDDIAIFATNSIRLGTGVSITGDVVANNASPGPVLDEGVELALDRNATVTGDATAVSVDLDNGASVSGTLTCDTGDAACTGLTPPVFPAEDIPVFLQADVRPEAEDVFVADGDTVTLGASELVCSAALTSCTTDADCNAGETCIAGRTTSYGDIVVDQGGTLVFAAGGRFDVRSITGLAAGGQCDPCRSIEFDAPTELRIEGRFDAERGAYVGPSSMSSIDASDIAIFVGGQNGATGGLFEVPRAANVGRQSKVHASFYAPNGTFELERESTMSGAVLAADVQIDKDSTFTGDSGFANKPPTADDKDAFTNGQVSIPIPLTGTDPEGQVLTFTATQPAIGSVSVAGSTATYTNNPATDEETSFTYTATDECGAVSAPATVRINPPGDPNTPPDDPTTEVVANDQLCASSVAPIDCELETIEDTAVTIILTAAAPCDPTGAPNPAEPCDGLPAAIDDVPLTFSVPPTTAQGGTLTGLNQGTGELQEPPAADEVPQRTASVLYTPPVGFTGVDSFSFDVTGDVDGSGGIDPSGEPNPEIDTGTVEISVQTFTPIPPVEARDQRVSTPMNTPVNIALSGGAGSCDPLDPDCRTGTPLTAPSFGGSSGPAPLTGATLALDDTGAPADADERLSYPTRSAAKSGPVTRVAAPGEDLFAIDSDLDQLFAVDPADGSATSLGSTTAGPGTPASLAFDGTKMYTIDLGGGGLYTLNVADGTPTFVCSTGISGWQGVASDPTDEGQFYGITQSDDLYKIDRTTCATTQVNAVSGTVGGLIAALEFDANGTLWGAEFGSPGSTTENAALVKINKTTGAVTIVSQCATRPCTGSDNFIDGFQGIDFATDGTLYGANTNDDSLYIIDTADGSVSNLGAHGTPVFVKGLAFSELVLLEAGFTITSLPAVGTLSYLNPATGTQTNIAAADLPLLLVTEEVTYTPPTGVTGDPLASFTYQQSDGLTFDTGTIELVVTGAIVIVDACAAVGRPPGCEAEAAGAGGESPAEFSSGTEPLGTTPNLRVVVEGKGTVTTSRWETRSGSVPGLSCSGECGGLFDAGDEVVLFARTLENSVFVGWGGDCSGSEPITTVRVGRRTTCIAIFEPER